MKLRYEDHSEISTWPTPFKHQLSSPAFLDELMQVLDTKEYNWHSAAVSQMVKLFGPGTTSWGSLLGTNDKDFDFQWILFSSYPFRLGFKNKADALLAKLTIE